MQVVSNKEEKEELVVKLYQQGKPIREIAQQAHLSFGTIGKIIRRVNGVENNETKSSDMKNKSKSTQALALFLHGKRPVEVAIELDLTASEIEEMQQEYWVLNKLDELALAYLEIRGHLDLFLRLFHIMKKNKLFNEKDIKTILKYAVDVPSLENKFRNLSNTVLDLEIKKKESMDALTQLSDTLSWYHRNVKLNEQILLDLDKKINQ